MDYIQSLVQDRYNVMMTSIDNYAKSLSLYLKMKLIKNYVITLLDGETISLIYLIMSWLTL